LLCATPTYLKQAALIEQPADLLQHDCLGHRHVGRDAWPLQNAMGRYDKVPIHAKYSSNEATVLLAMTLQHAGICMLPSNLVKALLEQGVLQEVLPEYPPQPIAIHAIYTSRQHLPKLTRAFLDYIGECFQHKKSHQSV
jgi:DNA-binding transcriptional LysR family regulator